MKFFADKLVFHRKQSHLTGEKIAKAMGVSRTTYWKWEKEHSEPNRKQVLMLAKILEIDVSEISDIESFAKSFGHGELDLSNNIESWLSFMNVEENKNFRTILKKSFKDTLKLSDKLNEAGIIIRALLTGLDSIFYIKDIDLKYITASSSFLKNLSLEENFKVYGAEDNVFFSKKEAKENNAKDAFRKIAANLKKAVKNFFENGGAQLIVKYGPDFVRMSNEAKEGTLSASEVLSVMNQVVVDAKEYGIITSTKATSIIEIVSSVNDIISTGKNAWNNPQVQETTIALMQNVVAITDGSVSDSTLLVMLNQLETILNAGGNYSTEILNSLESIAINTQNLLEGKLNESQYNSLESLISIIKQINETQSSSNLKVKVQCAFDFTRMVIEMHNDAVSGSLTASTAQTKLVNFLDTYYSVLGLNESQNNAAGEITNSLAIIINNNTEGLLPANQEKLVNLVVDIKEIASSKTVNYSLINKFVNDVEGICESKSAFVSSSFPQFVNIVENVYTLIAPKLNAGSNADVIINKTITLLNTIESLGNEPVANNLSVFFNGVRFVLDIAQSVQEKTITAANAQKQFNTYWTNDLYPTLINACPDKVAQINKIKSTLDTIFKYIVLVQN